MGSLGSGLEVGNDAALEVPAFGGIAELAVAADLVSLPTDPTHGGILGEMADPAQQHRVAGEAEDVADALALAPRHRFGPGVMAVAAHHDVDRRPACADMADDMA